MCSVVGYCGPGGAVERVLEGLGRLEYRGYDSAGCAFFETPQGRPRIIKTVGGVDPLRARVHAQVENGARHGAATALGHTRWSTHGEVSERNAHPHTDCFGMTALVHNGIIENHHELSEQLRARGHQLVSQADSELIAHVWEESVQAGGSLVDVTVTSLRQIKGAFSIGIMHAHWPGTLVAVRKSSPLCIGLGSNGKYIASDSLAFAGHARQVMYLPDESFAVITADACTVYDFAGNELVVEPQHIAHTWVEEDKGVHGHYMHKEIWQQPRVITDTVNFMRRTRGRMAEHMNITAAQIQALDHVQLIGCGTSFHAALIGELYMSEIAGLSAQACIASELRHRPVVCSEHTLPLCISQSGETADTLEAMRMIRATGLPTVAVVNVASSTMVREAQGFVLTQAGYEMAVASTKAFTAQMATLYWLAHWLAVERGKIPATALSRAEEELAVAAQALQTAMDTYEGPIAQRLAAHFAAYRQFMFIGRHIGFPFALEAALKLKEVAYCFVQTYPAGELKHGPLALVDDQIPIFIFSALDDAIYRKLCVNAQEIKARGGRLVVWGFEGQHELLALADEAFVFPRVAPLLVPMVMCGVMQLLVYHMARALDRPIDRPRNLAKSVTVE